MQFLSFIKLCKVIKAQISSEMTEVIIFFSLNLRDTQSIYKSEKEAKAAGAFQQLTSF